MHHSSSPQPTIRRIIGGRTLTEQYPQPSACGGGQRSTMLPAGLFYLTHQKIVLTNIPERYLGYVTIGGIAGRTVREMAQTVPSCGHTTSALREVAPAGAPRASPSPSASSMSLAPCTAPTCFRVVCTHAHCRLCTQEQASPGPSMGCPAAVPQYRSC